MHRFSLQMRKKRIKRKSDRMKRPYFCILLLFVASCQGQTTNSKYFSTYVLRYKTGNNSRLLFGLNKYQNGDYQFLSVCSISKKGHLVFLLDPIHNNVKRVNLKTGVLTASAVLAADPIKLTDIFVLNQVVFVASNKGWLFKLDTALSTIRKVPAEGKSGERKFFESNNRLFYFNKGQDVHQGEDSKVTISHTYRIEGDLVVASGSFDCGQGFERFLEVVDGYVPKFDCIDIRRKSVCLDRKFPGEQYPVSRYISIDENSLAFFEIIDDELVLSCYSSL